MKLLKKVVATVLSVITALSALAFAGCDSLSKNAPDYSDTESTYEMWAYHATYDGWWQAGDVRETEGIVDTNKQTLLDYKNAGFNLLFISYAYQLKGKQFKGSKVEQVMDWCHELGLKCIVFESALHMLSSTPESLINPEKAEEPANKGKFFASQEDLNAYVYENIKDIIEHPAYYGFSLKDEPNRNFLPAIGQVYKAIQAAKKGGFVNMNLWAYTTSSAEQWQSRYSENWASQSPEQNYIDYLNTYLECTGADYVQYDDYPLQGDNTEIAECDGDWVNVSVNHIKNYEIVTKWAKEKGIAVKKVMQSCSYSISENGFTWKPVCRNLSKTDMYWQTNIGMAFGQKSFTYWSYYPIVNVGTSEKYDETVCFIDKYGNKNDMYYWMTDIHSEMHGMAKALMNFEFNKLTKVVRSPKIGQIDYLSAIEKQELEIISAPVSETSGIGIVTELYDEENDRYGYFIVNVTDPTKSSEMEISFEVEGFTKVQIYNKGEVTNRKLENGVFNVELSTGEGVFIIPY